MNLTVSLVVVQLLSHVQLFCDPITGQAPLSMGFSRQEYWSGLPFPSPGDLPDPGIKPTSPVAPALQADTLLTTQALGKPESSRNYTKEWQPSTDFKSGSDLAILEWPSVG